MGLLPEGASTEALGGTAEQAACGLLSAAKYASSDSLRGSRSTKKSASLAGRLGLTKHATGLTEGSSASSGCGSCTAKCATEGGRLGSTSERRGGWLLLTHAHGLLSEGTAHLSALAKRASLTLRSTASEQAGRLLRLLLLASEASLLLTAECSTGGTSSEEPLALLRLSSAKGRLLLSKHTLVIF